MADSGIGAVNLFKPLVSAANVLREPVPGFCRVLRCMEIWGGTNAVDEQVSTPGLDAWVVSKPYQGDECGGDVHYVSVCGGGIVTRLVVADVSGHGMPVAEFSLALRDLMRRNINAKSQARFVRALNRQFTAMSRMERFATAVVGTYLASNCTLAVCNAGHPRPLWFRASNRSWSLVSRACGETVERAGNLPLGLDETLSFEHYALSLGQGDYVAIYTDALIEATDRSGRMLGEAGLLELARTIDASNMQPKSLGMALLEHVSAVQQGRPAQDDVTLLVLRHNASGPRRPRLSEKLRVYAKVFGLSRI